MHGVTKNTGQSQCEQNAKEMLPKRGKTCQLEPSRNDLDGTPTEKNQPTEVRKKLIRTIPETASQSRLERDSGKRVKQQLKEPEVTDQ